MCKMPYIICTTGFSQQTFEEGIILKKHKEVHNLLEDQNWQGSELGYFFFWFIIQSKKAEATLDISNREEFNTEK